MVHRLGTRTAGICTGSDGSPGPGPELRDLKDVPLKEDIRVHFEREVKPCPREGIDRDPQAPEAKTAAVLWEVAA